MKHGTKMQVVDLRCVQVNSVHTNDVVALIAQWSLFVRSIFRELCSCCVRVSSAIIGDSRATSRRLSVGRGSSGSAGSISEGDKAGRGMLKVAGGMNCSSSSPLVR